MNKKHYLYTYLIVSLIASVYIHSNTRTILEFLGTTLITFIAFTGIYFCFRNISSNKWPLRITKSLCIALCLALIYVSYAFAVGVRQMSTVTCPGARAENIFTKNIKNYCVYAPLFTREISTANQKVELGKEFVLKSGQVAQIGDTGLEVKILGTRSHPCTPTPCTRAAPGIVFEYRLNGQVQKGENLYQAFGYEITDAKIDKEVFISLTVNNI